MLIKNKHKLDFNNIRSYWISTQFTLLLDFFFAMYLNRYLRLQKKECPIKFYNMPCAIQKEVVVTLLEQVILGQSKLY